MINQGWQCPVCEHVYAPHVSMCKFCGKTDAIGTNPYQSVPLQPYQPLPSINPQWPDIPPITCKDGPVLNNKYKI